MDPSSLIFVAILGVWAAYLVPHWLRRRDELSQSRTPDRFSGGLRVLQRRSRRSRPDRSVHRSGDAVLTSPRVVVDADGEFLYIPADRALAARAQREAEEAARVLAEQTEAEIAAAAEAEATAAAEAAEAAELEAAELRAAEAQAARVKIAAQSRAAREEAAQVRAAQLEAAQTEALAQAHAMAQTREASAASTPAAAAYRASRTAAPEPAELQESADYPSDLEVAIAGARVAARRRATIMALLFLATVGSWVLAASSSPAWVAAPATGLLALHMLASRVAGLRSRESLMLLAVQVHSEELAESRAQRQAAAAARPAEVAATVEAALTPDRVSRRAAAVGASTWDPVPVPPPTYTLKPAVHRQEPAPLDVPAAPAAVSRGALPRRAADVERILGVESHLDELFEEPKVVNG